MKDYKERFWSKVNIRSAEECWEWTASKNKGYGQFWRVVDKKRKRCEAHRVAYEYLIGPIPAGLVIDHLCRNPGCVNPAHMDTVTSRENVLRGIGIPANNRRKKNCPQCGGQYTKKGLVRACVPCDRKRRAEWRPKDVKTYRLKRNARAREMYALKKSAS